MSLKAGSEFQRYIASGCWICGESPTGAHHWVNRHGTAKWECIHCKRTRTFIMNWYIWWNAQTRKDKAQISLDVIMNDGVIESPIDTPPNAVEADKPKPRRRIKAYEKPGCEYHTPCNTCPWDDCIRGVHPSKPTVDKKMQLAVKLVKFRELFAQGLLPEAICKKLMIGMRTYYRYLEKEEKGDEEAANV